jgi:hypothetical protein
MRTVDIPIYGGTVTTNGTTTDDDTSIGKQWQYGLRQLRLIRD